MTLEEFKKMYVRLEFSEDEVYSIPLEVIVEHKAKYYADKYDDSLDASRYYVWRQFFDHPGDIELWRKEDMSWDDVKDSAIKICTPRSKSSWEKCTVDVLSDPRDILTSWRCWSYE